MPTRNDNINTLSKKAIDSLLEPLTIQLRSLAESSGWPANIINSISVIADEDYNLHVDKPDELKEEIDDLEYGAEFGLPNAVIRPFLLRASATLESALEDIVLGDLFEEVGIV